VDKVADRVHTGRIENRPELADAAYRCGNI
jgi:hypothetical protein